MKRAQRIEWVVVGLMAVALVILGQQTEPILESEVAGSRHGVEGTVDEATSDVIDGAESSQDVAQPESATDLEPETDSVSRPEATSSEDQAEAVRTLLTMGLESGPPQLIDELTGKPSKAPATSRPEPATDAPPTGDATQPDNTFLVVRIIDGDTIEIEGGPTSPDGLRGVKERVRYIGIDTPESTTEHECYGQEAKDRNRQLVEGWSVRLVPDVEDRDKYGRLLRYVWVPASSAGRGDTFVNLSLAADGYATTLTIPPNVAHAEEFRAAERSARERNLGLWGGCDSNELDAASADRPGYDETIPQASRTDCPAERPIKGNAQSKIYHLPGGEFYQKTKPEECFTTEDEAVGAGYRKSRR